MCVFINGQKTSALIDTGGQISTITQDLAKQFSLPQKLSYSMKSIRLVTGNVVKGIDNVYTNNFQPGVESSANFLVLDQRPYALIVGIDILSKYGYIG